MFIKNKVNLAHKEKRVPIACSLKTMCAPYRCPNPQKANLFYDIMHSISDEKIHRFGVPLQACGAPAPKEDETWQQPKQTTGKGSLNSRK